MIKPEFPYKGNQIILSSDRVMLHSKSDAIFLFGKAAVGLSSTQTINLDAKEAIHASSQKIYLGDATRALDSFQPTILGTTMTKDLVELYSYLKMVADALKTVNESNLAAWAPAMRSAASILSDALNRRIINYPNGYLVSKNVYVK